MQPKEGDHVRMRVPGDRLPPVTGVVRHVYDANLVTAGLLVIERTEGGIACIPATVEIEILEPAEAGAAV